MVLIHGFNGETADMQYLQNYLQERGLTVYNLKLRGHNADKGAMAKHGYKDWIDGALSDIAEIASRHDSLRVAGLSMGGLLTVHAARRFALERLVFVNTPIYFWNFKQIFENVISGLKEKDLAKLKYYVCASHSAPAASLFNFLRILVRTKPLFKIIRNRSLVLQCWDDDTVKPKSAFFIKDSIGDSAKLTILKTGGHLVFNGDNREAAARAIYEFLAAD